MGNVCMGNDNQEGDFHVVPPPRKQQVDDIDDDNLGWVPENEIKHVPVDVKEIQEIPNYQEYEDMYFRECKKFPTEAKSEMISMEIC